MKRLAPLPVVALILAAFAVSGCAGKKDATTESLTTATELGDFGPRSPIGDSPGGFGDGTGATLGGDASGSEIFSGDAYQNQENFFGDTSGLYEDGGSGSGSTGASPFGTDDSGLYEPIDGGVGTSQPYDESLFDTPSQSLDGGFTTYGDPGSESLGGYSFAGDDGSPSYFSAQVGDTVRFDTDSSTLSSDARETLRRQAAWLQLHPEVATTVEGHADERGTREYNLALGARRANAVRSYLTSLGVSVDRVRTVSYGKERPIAPGSNSSAWAQNRRAVTTLRGGASF